MKKSIDLIFFVTLIFARISLGYSWTSSNIPDPKMGGQIRGWVSNPDFVLSTREVELLNNKITKIDDYMDLQIGVVVVKNLGQGIEDFATKTFNKWGIGQKETNRGLLIVLAIEDRKQRIEVGSGLEEIVSNEKAKEILDNYMAPLNRSQNFYDSIQLAISKLELLVNPQGVTSEQEQTLQMVLGASLFVLYSMVTLVIRVSLVEFIVGMIVFALTFGVTYTAVIVVDPNASLGFYFFYLTTATIFVLNALALFFGRRLIAKINAMTVDRETKYNRLGHKLNPLMKSLIVFGWPTSLIFLYESRRLKNKIRNQDLTCECQKQLSHSKHVLRREEESKYLPTPRIQEESIGSVDNDIWVCTDCKAHRVFRYIMENVSYQACPSCHLLGINITSRVVSNPSYDSNGLKEITHNCLICKYIINYTETIPRLSRSTSSGSGSSSGGSSWGGGSSRGGGASGSW